MSKWTNSASDPAGKIQVNRFNSAWGSLNSEHGKRTELSGIIGGEESSSSYWILYGADKRPEVETAKNKIGELYSWELSKKNAAVVTAAVLAELPALVASRPVIDKRRTRAEVQAESEVRACARVSI